jgi:hypothetical protein
MLKDKVPIYITIFVSVLIILKFFIRTGITTGMANEVEQWGLIVFAAAIILGVANISRVNLRVVIKKGRDWQYKIVLVISMFVVIVVGLFDLATIGNVSEGSGFHYIYEYVFTPLSATVFALLAFYIASAAFRAFRARNLRAAILLLSGALVMIGRVPLGNAINPLFPKMSSWLMTVPNVAGQRGMIIGAAMGMIATGLRVISGIERPYLKGE